MNAGGMSLGYLNYMDTQRKDETRQLEAAMMRNKLEEAQFNQQAEGNAGKSLMEYFQMPGQKPAPYPGQASKPASTTQAPAPAAPAQQQMAPSSNYKSYNDHVAAAQEQPQDQLVAPSANAGIQPNRPKGLEPGPLIEIFKRNNVSDRLAFKTLELLSPQMNAQQKADLDMLKIQTQIMKEQNSVSMREWGLQIKEQESDRKRLEGEFNQKMKTMGWQQKQQFNEQLFEKWTEESKSRDQRDNLLIQREQRLGNMQGDRTDGRLLQTYRDQINARLSELNNLNTNRREEDQPKIDAIRESLKMLTDQRDQLAERIRASHDAGDAAPGPQNKPAAGKPSAQRTSKPPMPTDPKYDYKWDDKSNQWLRALKQ